MRKQLSRTEAEVGDGPYAGVAGWKKKDFVKYSDASHKGLGCVLMQHGKRRQLELIKNNDWEILYHSGKANMVADALSKKERLKMIMSFGEFIRDFEKMKIEVKGIQEERLKDNLRGFIRKKDEVVERKMLGPAVVQKTKDMIDLIRGRLVVAQDGHDKIDEVRKERKAKTTICWTLGYIKTFGKLAYELALTPNT
ncbi:hypothetical protein AgCh_004327 [Apium graveolens]